MTHKEILEYLKRVREYYGIPRDRQLPIIEIVELLEAYDAVEPVTQEQANDISLFLMQAVETRRRMTLSELN